MILIAKIKKLIFNDGDYYVFSAWCGKEVAVTYKGDDPPKPLKNTDYQMIGEYKKWKNGRSFNVTSWKKGNIKICKPVNRIKL